MHPDSKTQLWAGRTLSGIAVLFLLMDGLGKLFKPAEVIEGTTQLGWPVEVLPTLGTLVLTGTVLYLLPQTRVLGALLLTGFLGGAVATHVRIGNPLFTHVLFPTYLAAFLWGGLVLRDVRLRAFLPFAPRTSAASRTAVRGPSGVTATTAA
jgi:DoxX-like family